MNKRSIVIASATVALLIFGFGAMAYKNNASKNAEATAQKSMEVSGNVDNSLIRSHSPIIGSVNAPVTIVEFFDPSCESCRTFYPVVKQILNRYPDDVRLILRYAPFHQGSDEAVGIIEAARRQNVFIPVLEALLEKQPEWAVHGAPNLNRAWNIAAGAGLNIEQAKQDLSTMNVSSILEQDMADIRANNVRATPTFFINGKPLSSFGQTQLIEAVDNQVTLIKGN